MKISNHIMSKFIYQQIESQKTDQEFLQNLSDNVSEFYKDNPRIATYLESAIIMGAYHPHYLIGFFHAIKLIELQIQQDQSDELENLFRK